MKEITVRGWIGEHVEWGMLIWTFKCKDEAFYNLINSPKIEIWDIIE